MLPNKSDVEDKTSYQDQNPICYNIYSFNKKENLTVEYEQSVTSFRLIGEHIMSL